MTYRARFHPLVSRDPEAITGRIVKYASSAAAGAKLAELEQEIADMA